MWFGRRSDSYHEAVERADKENRRLWEADAWRRKQQYSTTESFPETKKYWVIVDKQGDSYFTEGSAIPYAEFETERKKILDRGGKPPTIRIRFEEPPSNGGKEYELATIDLLAETEGDPLRKFCCRQCGECAPKELLEEGKFPERIAWLRHHYKEKHPGMWGKVQPAVILTQPPLLSPKEELEFVADSPEYLAYTIEDIGYREKLDIAFETAIARAKGE